MTNTEKDFSIRSIKQKDIPALIDLAHKTRELHTGTDSPTFWSAETLEKWCESELGVLLLAENEAGLIGAIICSCNPVAKDGYINAVFVSDSARRQGIGETLLNKAQHELAARGCNNVFTLVEPGNSSSEHLFTKCGFDKGKLFTYFQRPLEPKLSQPR